MIPAPRLPFDAPVAIKPGAGVEGPSGEVWCRQCAPISLYYLGAGTRLPSGWRMIRRQEITRRHRCSRCDRRLK